MGELDQLKAAAAALEAQRATLGAEVVEAGLRPLRERIDALESPVAEERKLVTTLFADLVGFTTMSERMDPEDVRTVLDRYFARWTASIEGHGGVVEKFIGDAVMAVFGMKQASENDAERAIVAALDMVGSLADLNEDLAAEGGPRLEMRVGINTGEVVIGAVGRTPTGGMDRSRRSDQRRGTTSGGSACQRHTDRPFHVPARARRVRHARGAAARPQGKVG